MIKKSLYVLILLFVTLTLTGCEKKFSLNNSIWLSKDDSLVLFTSRGIKWYEKKGEYDNNYYSGKYKLYIGDDAYEYITEDLSNYNVPLYNLQQIFYTNPLRTKDKFIVVDIRYDYLMIANEKVNLSEKQAPWYGFIADNGKRIDITDMNTGKRYLFVKKAGI